MSKIISEKTSKFIFITSLVIFPLGQLLRWQVPFFPGLRLHVLDLLVFWFVLAWFIGQKVKRKKFLPPPLFRPMAIFAGIASFSLILRATSLSLTDFLPAFFYLMRLFFYFFFYWSLTDFLKENNLPVFKYLIFEGVAMAALALAQYVFRPDMRFLFGWGWDEHFFRAIGTFIDPAFTGLLLVLSFSVWLNETLSLKKRREFWWWTFGLIILLAIGLSFSRASYLILLVALGTILIFQKKFKVFAVASLFFLFLIFFLPKPAGEGVNLLRTSSLLAKSDNYRQTWQIIKDNFWFGVGFNALRSARRDYGFLSLGSWQETNAGAGVDNSFLFVWAASGILGLVAFLFLWGKIIGKSLGKIKKSHLALILFSTTVSLSLSAFFVNAIFYPWVLFWLMLLLAEFTVES